jgi:corrinoid protein of di/trimethylamine methyltransferase
LRKVLMMADRGLPFVYAPGPIEGASAPVTLAGSLAIANAEVLSGLAIAQLRTPRFFKLLCALCVSAAKNMPACHNYQISKREVQMSDELFTAMRQSVIDGDAEQAEVLARQALERGLDPLDAINKGFVEGVNYVGQQFGCGEMFLPDLVLAGEAMKAAVAVLEPEMQKRGSQRQMLGRVVLGTVKGDIHEIGKTLVATMLSASGFQVYDLGVDVPFEKFAQKAREVGADIVGVSALLTTTMTGQKSVIEALGDGGLRPKVKVMVGGAPVTRSWADEIGADGYSEDAIGAVAEAKRLVGA